MRHRGFTLLEVALALGVMGVALMALVLLLARALADTAPAQAVRPAEVVRAVQEQLHAHPPEVATDWMLVREGEAWLWQECCAGGHGWKVTFTPGVGEAEYWVALQELAGGPEYLWLEVRP
ncbi:MAG: prepilin-type N-terminal cleavage/methylation domain-containing protein [Verrucomicrobiota bacterium JB022]|nr:prepilin-type N-terminal cleavage/methylation domain-containing protein [Verrucomicrobiota bacterium JB022]